MTMTANLLPPEGLLVDNPNTTRGGIPIPNAPEKRFALQTSSWCHLQTFIAQALMLPIVKEDFEGASQIG